MNKTTTVNFYTGRVVVFLFVLNFYFRHGVITIPDQTEGYYSQQIMRLKCWVESEKVSKKE